MNINEPPHFWTPSGGPVQDQVKSVMERGITAGEALQEDSPNDMEAKLYRGEYQLVFVSPEMILCDKRWDDILSSSVYQDTSRWPCCR